MAGPDHTTSPTEEPGMDDRTLTRKTQLLLTLHHVQQYGFTHPRDSFFLMLPKEFDAILALETKAVAQVVLEVMRETIGWYDPQGYGERREWAPLSYNHFVRKGIMAHGAAQRGMARALKRGYILRRRCGRGYEYALKWRGVNN
jgi:hypothetical protein